jgi:tetratricopeptide (TPR) repeat protein
MPTKQAMIEQLLERANEEVSAGSQMSAITYLYDILKLDRSRRDVARMIHDLEYDLLKRKRHWRRIRRVGTPVLVGVLLGVILEIRVQSAYEAIPPVTEDDVTSLEQRLAGLDRLIEDRPLWLGGFRARREQADLRAEIERLKEETVDAAQPDPNRAMLADSVRLSANGLVQQGDYEGAIETYQVALESAPPDWEHREQVETDLKAVHDFLKNDN